MDFKNKRVAIVGGAGGIGAALSVAFAKEGSALLVGDVAEEAGHALIAQIVDLPDQGSHAIAARCGRH